MPIFEYRCLHCDVTTEKILAKAEDRDKTVTKCPKCKGKMERVIHSKVAPFQWGKGGGWN